MAQEGYARKILIDGEPCIIGTLVERSDEKLTAVHDATEAQRLQQQRRAHQQVRAIAAGVDELTRLIEVGLSPDVVSDGPELSDRSERLLRLLHMGLTNQQIALETNKSLSTVKVTVSRLYKRLGVSNRFQL
jgi:DNA-binding NarL/FixJ family response regulator